MPDEADPKSGTPTGDVPDTENQRRRPLSDGERVIFPSDRVDDISNGLEFQIALDSLAGGNTDPLKIHLALLAGLDPNNVQIRSSPLKFDSDRVPESKFEYIGEMDNFNDLKDGGPPQPTRKPDVHLKIPDEIYLYSPLNPAKKQIRLLRLSPMNDEGVVQSLDLQIFDLIAAPRFLALSYVWGQPDKMMSLPCSDGKIMITQNLFRAIEVSFTRYPDAWLWADGICINQEDLTERGHQVAMMGDVYDQAALVIAHTGHHTYETVSSTPQIPIATSMGILDHNDALGLQDLHLKSDETEHQWSIADVKGKGDEDVDEEDGPQASSQPAISLMNYLSRIWSLEDDFSLKGDEEWKRKGLPNATREDIKIWLRLFEFWGEDWFHRSWVLQEAVLGKKVILLVGDAACSLDFVMQFWDLAKRRDRPEILKHGPLADEYSRILHLSPVSGMKELRDVKHPKQYASAADDDDTVAKETINESDTSKKLEEKSDLLNLLVLSRKNVATDPRDKVYSLLGLAREDAVAKSIMPDYSKANSTAILYRDIATKFIRAGRGTDLLKHAGIDQKLPGLPSWVPDWTYQSRSEMHSELYNCSGSSIPSISVSATDPNTITVRGVILDTITYAAMAWRYHSLDKEQEKFAPLKKQPDKPFPPFGDEDAVCLIRQMAKTISAEFCTKFDATEGVEAAMAKTLVMDCSWRLQRTRSDPSFLQSFNAFETLYGRGREEDTPLEHVYMSGIFHWVWDFEDDERHRLRTQSWPFEIAVQEAHKGRRFCVTKEGYMCTTSFDTERDDIVAMFEGFRTPFILRKLGDDWNLVGDCYVHGIMDGELLDHVADTQLNPNQVSIDGYGKPYSVRLSEGYATFQDFNIL
ncbi:heterokaryon incompatibility protein-domain-containing protein [Rhexocercosporidium sp. MPI-PUGE-AT-0058]|nr:heterokaryon incompatibility protein-domain-containing protein [Rhexocercosporidium sp. MPI-PUGE-AT-0058]